MSKFSSETDLYDVIYEMDRDWDKSDKEVFDDFKKSSSGIIYKLATDSKGKVHKRAIPFEERIDLVKYYPYQVVENESDTYHKTLTIAELSGPDARYKDRLDNYTRNKSYDSIVDDCYAEYERLLVREYAKIIYEDGFDKRFIK